MKKKLSFTGIAVVLALLTALPVLALSDISDAIYSGTVRITNAGAVTTNVATVMTLDTAAMIASGYIEADCTDIAIRINTTTDATFMPSPGDDDAWCVFVPTVGTAAQDYTLYAGGGTDMAAKIRYFPAAGGMANSGNYPNLGAVYDVEISGYFDLAGAGNYVYYRTAAGQTFTLTNAGGQIRVTIFDGVNTDTVDTAGLSSGDHTVKVSSDATNVKIYWDSVLANGTGIAGKADVLRTAALAQPASLNKDMVAAAVMPYMSTFKVWVSGVLIQSLAWNYDAAAPYEFTDLSGNGNTAIPTFRTTSSDADVAATMLNFTPLSQAIADSTGTGAGDGIFNEAPDEPPNLYTEDTDTSGFILAPIFNGALDKADIPRAAFWYPIVIIFCIGAGFFTYIKTKSILFASLVIAVLYAIAWQTELVAGWVMWFFVPGILAGIIQALKRG